MQHSQHKLIEKRNTKVGIKQNLLRGFSEEAGKSH